MLWSFRQTVKYQERGKSYTEMRYMATSPTVELNPQSLGSTIN